MSPRRYILFLALFFYAGISYCQEFRNIQLIQRGDFVDITYDLQGTAGRTYTILVFSSHNDGSKPLEFVNGDVGPGIVPGDGKKIIWNANLEVGNQNMTVNISLEGDTEPPFVSITNPSGGKIKKGKSNIITWKSISENRVRIDVLKGGKSFQRLGDVPNNGSYTWNVSKEVENGKNYQLRFSNLSNNNVFITSDYFAIGPSIGMGVKIGAAAILAGIIVYFIIPDPPEEDPIPLPARPE